MNSSIFNSLIIVGGICSFISIFFIPPSEGFCKYLGCKCYGISKKYIKMWLNPRLADTMNFNGAQSDNLWHVLLTWDIALPLGGRSLSCRLAPGRPVGPMYYGGVSIVVGYPCTAGEGSLIAPSRTRGCPWQCVQTVRIIIRTLQGQLALREASCLGNA